MANGIPEDLFWRLTPVELGALLHEMGERESRREYQRALLAGLIAAEVRNTMRSRNTDRVWKAQDFVRQPKPKAEERPLTGGETRAFLKGWAMRVNAAQKAKARR